MKILLVDDEERVLRGVSRWIKGEIDQWEVVTAASGAEALRLLESGNFNVIVSEMQMSGMDGAELLSRVEQRHPDVFRVVLSGQADRDTALTAVQPMHQYLSKPCDLNVLVDAIKRAETFQATITSPAVLDAIGQANGLSSVPGVISEINAALAGERWNAQLIATIVARDPMLSARTLQVANSAIFALPYPVLDVNHAVSLVGADVILGLALSQAVMLRSVDETAIRSSHALFNHSFQVAVLAREFTRHLHPSDDTYGAVFSGALLHDIGKLILMDTFPDQYSKLLRVSVAENRPLWELELDGIGATHQGVGAYLLALWGLPAAIVEIVASHHNFDVCSRRSLDCQVVYAVNWLYHGGDEDIIDRGLKSANHTAQASTLAKQLLKWKHDAQIMAVQE
ncbi:Nitrogen assimilation regulatory protein [Stieleria maiorica]|uniref:Nitrogen assimilation regulatory protein n=1 Tax=Stieleria maiorica TaxID=2795974 RepID=A0A5B9M652_9BACT|nr:response regulator [Stieleria maiorica]QEF96611.1 Nitrogen assimilation regulatory protein [Stieleria maiorica]